MSRTIDVGNVIDKGSWTGYQKLLILGTALTIILDGIDNQLLGNAIPSLMKEWSLPRGAFSTALAMSPFGMMIGGVSLGVRSPPPATLCSHSDDRLHSIGRLTCGVAFSSGPSLVWVAQFVLV